MMASCATVRLCRPASSLDFFIFLKKHFAKIYDGLEILQFWHPFVMSHDHGGCMWHTAVAHSS
jgi:hypothetical protein